jgi:CHAD domain-containing protein
MMYQLKNMAEFRRVTRELGKEVSIDSGPLHEETRFYYDTFDWRIFSNGYSLYRIGSRWSIRMMNSGAIVKSIEATSAQAECRYWWHFPEGDFRELLRSMTSIRTLLQLCEIHCSTQHFSAMNIDGKIVSHLELLKFGPLPAGQTLFVRIRSVRGYKEETALLEKIIRSHGEPASHANAFMVFMSAAGLQPGDYSSKFISRLHPDMTLAQAAVTIFRQLLVVIEKNRDGVIEDLDTEYLHDLRVAIRRTRSALTQFKGVFPERTRLKYKKAFAEFGKASNILRDLDVYLLKKGNYKKILPPDLQAGLDPLFDSFISSRKKEHRDFTRVLRSAKYRNFLRSWAAFLDKFAESKAASMRMAAKPVLPAARQIILKRYRKILKKGARINSRTKDESLHQLRIECKKLRYSLEFFRSLFPAEDMENLISQLKKIQDVLGNFNDFSVQRENLGAYLNDVPAAEEESSITGAAIGGLITQLYQQQRSVRDQFHDVFAEFSKAGNIRRYEQLFAQESS